MNGPPNGALPLLMFVAPYFPPGYYGGVVQVYLGLLERLQGFRVVVVTDRQNCSTEEQEVFDRGAAERAHFVVRRIGAFEFHLQRHGSGSHSGKYPRMFASVLQAAGFLRRGKREWRRLMRELKPDLIVCGGTCSAGWLMREVPASTPFLNYVHGEELTMQLRPRPMMWFMRRRQMHILRSAKINIAVSDYTARLIQRLAGTAPSLTLVFPNFVDTSRFRLSMRKAELRTRFGWEHKLVILTLARLEPRKGIDQALRALAMLHAEKCLPMGWVYVICGRGRERAALDKLCGELGIDDHVSFRGFVVDEDVAALYEAADIFLQPNREIAGDTEGFGIVFLEASACGLPVIGGKAGGTADAIEEGVSGYRVDGDDVSEIASALKKLVCDEELRARLGAQGAARVADHFGVDRSAPAFQKILTDVLGNKV